MFLYFRSLILFVFGAVCFASGVFAGCASTVTCDSAAVTNGPFNQYSIGFLNQHATESYCIYVCKTNKVGYLASTIVPSTQGNDQYWPMVGTGQRFAAYRASDMSKFGLYFPGTGNEGRELYCNGQISQYGSGFVVKPLGYVARRRTMRRLLGRSSGTIYSDGNV